MPGSELENTAEYSSGDCTKTTNYLFNVTIKRNKRWNLEKTYDCKYKFQVNDVEYPIPIQQMPESDSEGGIMLVVTVQWDIIFDLLPAGSPEKHQGPAYDRIFFLPRRSLEDSSEVEDALADIISPLLGNLGITSFHERRSVTGRFVASAEFVYSDHESRPSKWQQINLDIVVQTTARELDESRHWVYWLVDESTRFCMGLELKKKEKENNDDDNQSEGEEDCCAICREEFPVECDLVRLPSCSHKYHEDCIMLWFDNTLNCTLCRAPVPDWDRGEWRYLPNLNLQIE